jgi:D-glycero-D-manno-heptose 1,7-bisphosphate phosphatase
MKVAFLDRDGTIIRDYPDKEWSNIQKPEFLSGAIDGLKYIQKQGYKIIIITNQYLIDEGFITLEQYHSINTQFLETLSNEGVDVLDVFFCPHDRDSGCNCCKPKPGLIKQALEKHPGIDLKESFLVGDSLCDIQLAEYFDIKCFSIGRERENSKLVVSLSAVKNI